jgi:hypothetical protein
MSTNTTTIAPLTVAGTIHFARRGKVRELRDGLKPTLPAPGRVPRVARLMALALKFDRLIRDGAVADQAELARLGHVTRARTSPIMNLHLAPDTQEALLFLPVVERGRDPIVLRDLQSIAMTPEWRKQLRAGPACSRRRKRRNRNNSHNRHCRTR